MYVIGLPRRDPPHLCSDWNPFGISIFRQWGSPPPGAANVQKFAVSPDNDFPYCDCDTGTVCRRLTQMRFRSFVQPYFAEGGAVVFVQWRRTGEAQRRSAVVHAVMVRV